MYMCICTFTFVLCVLASYSLHREGRGRGLFLTKDVEEGATLLRERPLVAMQQIENRATVAVCACCLRFVGSLQMQCDLLAGTLQNMLPKTVWCKASHSTV